MNLFGRRNLATMNELGDRILRVLESDKAIKIIADA